MDLPTRHAGRGYHELRGAAIWTCKFRDRPTPKAPELAVGADCPCNNPAPARVRKQVGSIDSSVTPHGERIGHALALISDDSWTAGPGLAMSSTGSRARAWGW